jgi:hypothetical protein
MCVAEIQERHEARHIEIMITGAVELNGFALDQQKRWLGGVIAKRSTELRQGLAQIHARSLIGLIGPE